ncbi:MAG: efflux RND transporter periplasmic adaptor subunit [Bacteroidaceae bacterium]|jgi:membrane fusion protein (multidrug efflux system)
MKKINIIIAVFLFLLTVFFLKVAFTKSDHKKHDDKENVIKKVDGFIVSPTYLSSSITVTGSLLAFNEVELRNEVAGRIVMVNLPEGKIVKKNTLLVKLYDADLQAALLKLKLQLDIQKRIYQRQTQLLKVKGISQNDYDQTLLQINSLKADIAEEKALIRKTEVRAPFDGTIGLRQISVGAFVSASTLLATIRTNQSIKLDFYVPEKYSTIIKNGMKVSFTMAGGNTNYSASVIATEHNIENSTRNLKVRAMVKNSSQVLVPGAFANVSLNLGSKTNALMIPSQAIIPEDENKSVIVARDGKAHFVNIKTGIRKSSMVEVTEGLTPGDTIITSGILFLKEGGPLEYPSVKK